MPAGADHARALAIVEGVWLGRDLINTPASDMGPQELEDAARLLAKRHGAEVTSIVGDDLRQQNFPMIHAVGRASDRAAAADRPHLGQGRRAPRVTLVGKGICFDTGGLDIKPASGMLMMKKDMGGAAAALALAHMIMASKLDVRLRVLIPAAENSVAGNAFRPGDVLDEPRGQDGGDRQHRCGRAAGAGRCAGAGRRGAARHARELRHADGCGARGAGAGAAAALYRRRRACRRRLPRRAIASAIRCGACRSGRGYESTLDSAVADMNNVSDGPFAGSVTAALFLRRFVKQARRFAHFDIYGWRPAPKPLGPKGGEVQAARALFELLRAAGAAETSRAATVDHDVSRSPPASLSATISRQSRCADRVSAPRYVAGETRQVVHSATPLRAQPEPRASWTSEVLFGELVTVYDEKDGWAWVQLRARRLCRLSARGRALAAGEAGDAPGAGAEHVPLSRRGREGAALAAAQHDMRW